MIRDGRAETDGGAAVNQTSPSVRSASPGIARRWNVALGLALLVVAAFHLTTLTRFPAPFVDEAWAAARAWNFKKQLVPFSTLDSGVFDRLPGYQTFFPYIPTALQSLVYLGAKTPTLLPLRVESLAAGLLLLVAVFSIGRSLHGPIAGMCALLVVGFSGPFFGSARLARYDIFAAALGYWALALVLGNRERTSGRHFLAGLFATLTLDVHAHGVVIAAALPLLLVIDRPTRFFRDRCSWALAVGCASGVLVYFGLHVVRYPQGFAEFNRIAFSPTHTPPLLAGSAAVARQGLVDFGWSWYTSTGNLSGLVALGLGLLLVRRSPGDLRLLAISTAVSLAFALLIRNKQWYYDILFWPCFGLTIGAMCGAAIARINERALYRVLAGVVVSACALGTWVNTPRLSRDVFKDQRAILSAIAPLVNPHDKVMAKQNYWFGLYDNTYYSYEGLVYYMRYAPGSSVKDAFAAFKPDIFIFDSLLAPRITDNPGKDLYSQHLSLSRTQVMQVFQERGKIIGRFQSPLFGNVIVIRLKWNDERAPTAHTAP